MDRARKMLHGQEVARKANATLTPAGKAFNYGQRRPIPGQQPKGLTSSRPKLLDIENNLKNIRKDADDQESINAGDILDASFHHGDDSQMGRTELDPVESATHFGLGGLDKPDIQTFTKDKPEDLTF